MNIRDLYNRSNSQLYMYITIYMLQVKLPYEHLCPSVGWSVCMSITFYVIISQKGRDETHLPFPALKFFPPRL